MYQIKYAGKSKLASYIVSFGGSSIEEYTNGYDCIVPVPLHWTRMQKRGFNQARYIAMGIAESCKLPVVDNCIKRIRTTGTQTQLDRTERRKNLQNAFCVPENKIDLLLGKKVILVDDVITTGATTAVCAETLLHAGCKEVKVIAIARD
jgi:ComF family protein